MNIDKKKKLATRVMNKICADDIEDLSELDLKEVYTLSELEHWNPHENTDHFIEVIRALSPEQLLELDAMLGLTHEGYLSATNGFMGLLWLIDNKDKVLQAVLEVCDG